MIVEGVGPPPPDMNEELRWTMDGFARIDRAFRQAAGAPSARPYTIVRNWSA